jgi:hypothetical protein
LKYFISADCQTYRHAYKVNENESLPGGDKGDINHKGDIREI